MPACDHTALKGGPRTHVHSTEPQDPSRSHYIRILMQLSGPAVRRCGPWWDHGLWWEGGREEHSSGERGLLSCSHPLLCAPPGQTSGQHMCWGSSWVCGLRERCSMAYLLCDLRHASSVNWGVSVPHHRLVGLFGGLSQQYAATQNDALCVINSQ